jgi:hypothetical protein
VVASLYALDDADPTRWQGEAMIQAVVDPPECPAAVLATAHGTGLRHRLRAVERRRASL